MCKKEEAAVMDYLSHGKKRKLFTALGKDNDSSGAHYAVGVMADVIKKLLSEK